MISFFRRAGGAHRLTDSNDMLVLALTVALALAAGFHGVASAASTPLRQVDWRFVLTNDPSITLDPDAYQPPVDMGPYINVSGPNQTGDTLAGYADVEDVLYADLDGDGAEEAVIPVESGGTGGSFGFMLYREGSPDPRRVLTFTGYKVGVKIDGNHLAVTQPDYVGFEPNCCPSALTRTVNALNGDTLVTLTTEVRPYDNQAPTVQAFYAALSDKHYEDAYAFLSPAFKANNPFDRWKAGYAATQRIEVETKTGATPTEVLIDLTSTDGQASGSSVTHEFRGSWTVIWSAEQTRWLLDKPNIQQVS